MTKKELVKSRLRTYLKLVKSKHLNNDDAYDDMVQDLNLLIQMEKRLLIDVAKKTFKNYVN